MANAFQNALNKFNKLPTPAKAGIAVGAGMVLYLLFNKKASSATESESDEITTDNDGTVYYPYADAASSMGFSEADYAYNNLGFAGGGEVITLEELGEVFYDSLEAWGENYMKSPGDKDNDKVGDTISAGGELTQQQKDQKLYEAQLAYGNAKTSEEKSAAAAAGQKARQEGATDEGAQKIWQQNASGKTNSSGSGSRVMVSGKGGSGKEFTKLTDGSITVKYTNGTSRTIKPGESGYSVTQKAMNADLGLK